MQCFDGRHDESGRIPLLRAVKQIEQQLAADANPRGYLPIDGLPAYTQATRELVFGKDSPLLAAGPALEAQARDGLIEWDGRRIQVTVLGKPFLRATAALFDTYLQAGAGIVADSEPDDEDLECRNKAAALLAAVPAARRMTARRRSGGTPA